jgi:hypothetical protein
MARAETAYLNVPSVFRDKIGIGEAGNLTDHRDERDHMDEQSEDGDRGGKARGQR